MLDMLNNFKLAEDASDRKYVHIFVRDEEVALSVPCLAVPKFFGDFLRHACDSVVVSGRLRAFFCVFCSWVGKRLNVREEVIRKVYIIFLYNSGKDARTVYSYS